MVSSDFRKDAREKLTGKWSKAALITLAYFAVFYVINLLLEHTSGFANLVVSILNLLIEIPLGFGLVVCFVKLFNGEDVKTFSFFSFGFDNFGKSWGISLRTALKLLLPLILFIISIVLITAGMTPTALFAEPSSSYVFMAIIGFILYFVSLILIVVKSYYYEMTYMIAAENPEITSKDVVQKSRELMQNNRFKLFCLEFSFIGWAFLAGLTLGIGLLWLAPYMQFARISFYKHLIKE